MKEVKPGIYIDDKLCFELTEEQKKWLEETNEKTRKLLDFLLTEGQKFDKIDIIAEQ